MTERKRKKVEFELRDVTENDHYIKVESKVDGVELACTADGRKAVKAQGLSGTFRVIAVTDEFFAVTEQKTIIKEV